MLSLEFNRRYSMAHRLLSDPSSKCRTPHGHDEYVFIRLRPATRLDLGGSNMSASFERAKRAWHGWIDSAVDHAFQANLADPLIGFFREHEPETLARVMTFDGDPTTEALAIAMALKAKAFLAIDGLFTLESLRIQETPTNAVGLDATDMAGLAGWAPGQWCLRADNSINDF